MLNIISTSLKYRNICPREISIMYFKSTDNTDGFFPISENYHENGILKKTIAPSLLSKEIEDDLKLQTKTLCESLGLYGILAIELFELFELFG